jgi:hypothetical protein
MTYVINLRHSKVGGFVTGAPSLMQGDGQTPDELVSMRDSDIAGLVAGKDILFFVHGFNVNFEYGARSFANMVPLLNLQHSDVAIGVLWPGDSWVPYINYVIEGNVAVSAGNALAKFCRAKLSAARSFSFASHSLGARVVLQTLLGLDRPARSVTLAAGAINQNCLAGEYRQASENKITTLSVLASRGDDVLKLAFPLADPICDILEPDHSLFQPALGYAGPSVAEAGLVDGQWRIGYTPGASYPPNYGHGSYLPPGDPASVAAAAAIAAANPGPTTFAKVAAYFANVFYGRPQNWPG